MRKRLICKIRLYELPADKKHRIEAVIGTNNSNTSFWRTKSRLWKDLREQALLEFPKLKGD